jgi:diaminopimelate epimerase
VAQSNSKPRAFGKYQGLGNDFLIIDLREPSEGLSPEAADGSGFYLARKLCDRRRGVGGDGVLTLGAPTSPGAVASMRVLNADGSEAEMCGNGLRCVAKYLFESGPARIAVDATPDELTVDTGAGPLLCLGHWSEGVVESVTVSMGKAHLLRGEISMTGDGGERCLEQSYTLQGRSLDVSAVSMGNPHAICFVPEKGPALMDLATQLGPELETHVDFPKRTNAEFAHVHARDSIELVVWERGVGITQACGTGACATAVAACLAGLSDCDTEIDVALPGGSLSIRVADDYSQVWMRGPAEKVYTGSVDLATL